MPPQVLAVLRTAGVPLDAFTRTRMEATLQADLGDVRVHDDRQASKAAARVGARAFTYRNHIVFAEGEFQPGTAGGNRLLQHELVHVLQQRRHSPGLQFDKPKGKPPTPEVDSPLSTEMLLQLAIKQLAEIDMRGMAPLVRQLEMDKATPGGTKPAEEAIRAHALQLLQTLKVAKPVLQSLGELAKPELYLPGVAKRIVARLQQIQGEYATAVMTAYSDIDPEGRFLRTAEEDMLAFPDYLTEQYLEPQGIPALIAHIPVLVQEIADLRHHSGGGATRRPAIEKLLNLTPRDLFPTAADFNLQPRRSGGLVVAPDPRTLPGARVAGKADMEDLIRAAKGMRGTDPQQAAELTQKVLIYAEFGVSALTALALEEQFTAFESILDDSWIDWLHNSRRGLAKKYHKAFDLVLQKFEALPQSKGPEDSKKRLKEAQSELAGIINSQEFKDAVSAIKDRINTIQTVRLIGKVALVIAASALTAGEAGVLAGGLLRLAGASELVVGAGAFVAEALVFTAVQRKGEEVAFGKVEGTFAGDFLTNLAMFGALKGVGKLYGSAFKLGPEAGRGARAAFQAGRVGTAFLTLHGFAELQHLITDPQHKWMSGEERYRTVLQNVILLGAFEAGRFITQPIEKRLGDIVTGKLKTLYSARLARLGAERADLKARLDELARAKATAQPEDVTQVLERIEKLWNEELKLFGDAAKRLKLTAPEVDATLAKYQAQRATLELQMARLGFNAPLGAAAQKPAFERAAPSVVAFDPAQRATLEAFYKDQGGTLGLSKDFPELLEGRLGHEVTFYLPKGELPPSTPDASRIAEVRDRAQHEADADPRAKEGLERLTRSKNFGFAARTVDSLLASVPAADLGAFLRAMADPGFAKQWNRQGQFERLAQNRKAIDFAVIWGANGLKSLVRSYGWGDALSDSIDRASRRLQKASPDARSKLQDEIANATTPDELDGILGREKAPAAPKPERVTKKNMGVDRRLKLWESFRASEEKFARDHGENPAPDVLDMRADLMQSLDRAKQGSFKHLTHDTKVSILDRFDELGVKAGIDRGRLNALRGSLAEALFAPEYGKAKTAFKNHAVVKITEAGATVPDYDHPGPGGTREWVNLKSDLIDEGVQQKSTGAYQAGIDAARRYRQDSKTAANNVPENDHVSLDFIRDPGFATRIAMLDILFSPDSPVYRVKFGRVWHTRP